MNDRTAPLLSAAAAATIEAALNTALRSDKIVALEGKVLRVESVGEALTLRIAAGRLSVTADASVMRDRGGDVDVVVVRGSLPAVLEALTARNGGKHGSAAIIGDDAVLEDFRRGLRPARIELDAGLARVFADRFVGAAEIGVAALKSVVEGMFAEGQDYARARYLNDDAYHTFASKLDELTKRVNDVRRRIDALES